MAQTFTGRKRVRKVFGHITEVAEMPNLIEVQKASYDQFLIVDAPKGGRADEGLQSVFKSVFRQFTLLCKRLDLFGRELLAVDGTRIKAVNNKDRNFTRSSLRAFIRAADERLEDFFKRLDEGDVADGATSGGTRTKNLAEKIAALSEKRGRYQAMLAQLERTGEDQISLTDPDSRAMAAHTKIGVGYNIQVAVDAKHKLIVEQAVTNQVVDMGLLTQTSEPAAKRNL